MKQLFLPHCLAFWLVSTTVGLMGCGTHSTPSEAPSAVQQALHHKFGGPLEQLTWQPSANGWVASFQWKSIPVRCQITAAGQVVESALELQEEDVPQGLRTVLQQRYRQYQVRQKDLVEAGNKRFYRLELTSPAGETRSYSFQRDGQFIPTNAH
ncbi:hypothetical protein [Hymenobacter seoulensis]